MLIIYYYFDTSEINKFLVFIYEKIIWNKFNHQMKEILLVN